MMERKEFKEEKRFEDITDEELVELIYSNLKDEDKNELDDFLTKKQCDEFFEADYFD
jgi:hypothetical protein